MLYRMTVLRRFEVCLGFLALCSCRRVENASQDRLDCERPTLAVCWVTALCSAVKLRSYASRDAPNCVPKSVAWLAEGQCACESSG